MESLSKFFAKSVTIVGTIGGTAFAWLALTPDAFVIWQGLAILAFGSAAVGGAGWFTSHRRLQRDYAQRREQRMITAAKRRQGRVTDVELVAETRYPLEECRGFLKAMTESGSAEMQIGKEGTVVYLFPGFLTETEKRDAQSPADWMPRSRDSPRENRPPPLESSSTKSLELE